MILALIAALLLGVLSGTITGLTPGIHINLIGAITLSLSFYLLKITSPIILITFIISMAIAHTFIDFIPSIFLGAPNEETVLSILPGHKLLQEGRGYEAILLSSYGSLYIIPITILLGVIFILFLQKIEPIIIFLIPMILIVSSAFIIITEKNKITALFIFILSGFLGVAILNSNLTDPLFPMLTGLFGASSLIISIKNKTQIPPQNYEKVKIKKRDLFSPLLGASLISPICSFIPGLGSGQAAVIASTLIKQTKEKFLVLLGATNIIVLCLSIIVLYSIEKSRTGIAVTIDKLIPNLNLFNILIITCVIILSAIISFFLTLSLAKKFSKIISKINYQKLSITILIFLSLMVILFSGPTGLFVFIISTTTGIYGILSNVKRINLMGCLLIPTIIIYLM